MSNESCEEPFEFTEANIKRLKEKYSNELKDDLDNPIRVCMKLVFDAAIEKDSMRRAAISYELSQFLIKSDGVINLFLALIDFDTSSQKVTTHNRRFLAIANIITCLPKLCVSYEDYCASIFNQIKPLLISDNKQYANLASIILRAMLDSPHGHGKNLEKKMILTPIFDSLSQSQPVTSLFKPHESILAIHNLISNHLNVKLFVDIFPNLFYSLVLLINTPSYLKSILKSCLVAILDGLKPGVACCLLEETLFYRRDLSKHLLKHAEESGISIKVIVEEVEISDDDVENYNETIVSIVIAILKETKESHILEFFFKFQEAMWSAKDLPSRQLSASLIEPLLSESVREESTKLDLSSIIASNACRSLELICRTLLNYVGFLRDEYHDETNETKKLINQSIEKCFDILGVLAVTLSDNDDLGGMRKSCVPVLKEIKVLIERNGQQNDGIYKNLVSLLGNLEEVIQVDDPSLLRSAHSFNGLEFQDIMKDLNDKLPPVRVHALVKLKQLVLANDRGILLHFPQIYSVIESSLADEEPYVFLASINLLAEMSIRKTDEMLPKLLELYSKPELGVQFRINVGEVLVRLTKQLNQATPYYAQQVFSTLLISCKDPEELIRMSSLTNIGEICRYLGDSLGKYMVEILFLIESIIDNDFMPVKCAAIDLLRTTLMGLDKFKMESIRRELKSMYNLLKKLKSRTLDDELCLQLDLALDEIDRLAREMLGAVSEVGGRRDESATELVKNIKMLSLLK